MKNPPPPAMRAAGLYRERNSDGYDGQYYLMVARDPLLRNGDHRYVDSAIERYRRILVPGLAHLFGGTDYRRLCSAFVGLELLFVAAGAGA